jgi:hypothetical protein
MASLIFSNSTGLRILTSNFSDDLTMALNVYVKILTKLNAFHGFECCGHMDPWNEYINGVKF